MRALSNSGVKQANLSVTEEVARGREGSLAEEESRVWAQLERFYKENRTVGIANRGTNLHPRPFKEDTHVTFLVALVSILVAQCQLIRNY